jgi:hypothetical protein
MQHKSLAPHGAGRGAGERAAKALEALVTVEEES